MDEELNNLDENIVETEIYTEDIERDIESEEVVETVEVEAVEEVEIVVDEAVGWVGGDSTRHYSLYGRDEADQHPITSITGLREELDDIEALGIVSSNERNQANYYLWADEISPDENRVGYFVSICPGIEKIKLCDSDNAIFGVTVDNAGFIGAQDDIVRDYKYGLVVTSGVVHVRCEEDVVVGDYVISNNYGYATKNKSGYKVVGVHDIDGVEHAEIMLVTPISRICDLTDEVDDLSERMDDAETNIAAAMNIANAAYNKASEAGDISEEAIKNAIEALDKSNETADKTDELETSVSSANEMAVQAKTIAEGAALSAITLRDEAVKNANKALQDTSKLRDDFKNTTEKMDNDLQGAILDIRSLEGDLAPLAIWPQDSGIENANGVAGFVAKANEDSATLASVTKFEGEFGKSLTGFVQEATAENATVKALAAYEQKDENGNVISSGAAGLISQVDANKASISAIAEFNGDIAGLQSQVNKNTANVSIVTKRIKRNYVIVDSWSQVTDESKDKTKTYYAKDEKLYWYYGNSQWQSTDDAYTAGLPYSVAGIQVETDNHSSKINSLVDWKGETKESMARIEQKADDNGASINLLVSSVDKYSVGEYSQAYGLTREQAKSILKEGYVYIPTKNFNKCCDQHANVGTHCETMWENSEEKEKGEEGQKEVNEFTPSDYYVWGINDQGNADWIEHSVGTVWISSRVPANSSGTYKYWYIDSNEPDDGYEPYTLYIWETPNNEDSYWKKVNTLAGNVNNRITSTIRQTADEIALEVANVRGSYAGLDARISNTESEVQAVAAWAKDPDGNLYNLATIKQTADDAGASVAQVAAQICSEYETIEGDWDETDKNTANVYYTTKDKKYWYYKDGVWSNTNYPTEAGLAINAASIVTAINNTTGDSIVKIDANHVIVDGSQISLKGKNIDLTSDDITINSTNFSVDATGNIRANSGQIGGWDIGSGMIQKYANGYRSGMASSGALGSAAFYAGVPNESGSVVGNANFYVTHSGELYSKAGTIGGWNIGDSALYKDLKVTESGKTYTYRPFIQSGSSPSTDTAAFGVRKLNSDGSTNSYPFYVRYNGQMRATAGDIGGWTINNNILESSYGGYRMYLASASSISSGTSNWIRCYNTADGDGGTYFSVSKTGRLTAKDATIQGKLEAGSLISNSGWKVTSDGFRIGGPGQKGGGVSFDGLVLSVAAAGDTWEDVEWMDVYNCVTEWLRTNSYESDRNVKNSISVLESKYELLFDNLIPCRYKYNHGTSDRFHTGFIAQDVVNALHISELNTQDFAGVVNLDKPNRNGCEWLLRRDEFVALNTWQIQKAKARITELENRVTELEKLINKE